MSQDRATLIGAAVIAAAIVLASLTANANGRYAITTNLVRLDTRTGDVEVCRMSGPYGSRVIRCGADAETAAQPQQRPQARPQPQEPDSAPAVPQAPDSAKSP